MQWSRDGAGSGWLRSRDVLSSVSLIACVCVCMRACLCVLIALSAAGVILRCESETISQDLPFHVNAASCTESRVEQMNQP